jgi:hypothetical protein
MPAVEDTRAEDACPRSFENKHGKIMKNLRNVVGLTRWVSCRGVSSIGWILMASLLMVGCQGKPAVETSGAGDTAAHSDHDDDLPESMREAIAAAMAELSEEDRAQAERQKICPVSMEPLGSMGVPMKVDVAGQEVFICCEGCTGPLQEDPEAYLANLK